MINNHQTIKLIIHHSKRNVTFLGYCDVYHDEMKLMMEWKRNEK